MCKGGRTVRLTFSHVGFHDGPPTMPKGVPGTSSYSLGLFSLGGPFTPGVPGPFCYLSMWLQSHSTPTHGQTTIQAEGKSHPNTTAELTHLVHKSEGRIRSNRRTLTLLWATCWTSLHSSHLLCVNDIQIPLVWRFYSACLQYAFLFHLGLPYQIVFHTTQKTSWGK